MEYIYGSQDFTNLKNAQQNCILMTNGRGGYASVTAGFGVNRCDQGLLIAAESAPNKRNLILHRISEMLCPEDEKGIYLSTQEFDDGKPAEEGYRHLSCMKQKDGFPDWTYFYRGVTVKRRMVMEHGCNRVVLVWHISNQSGGAVHFSMKPYFSFCPKGENRQESFEMKTFRTGKNAGFTILANGLSADILTNGRVQEVPVTVESLHYDFDERDGRRPCGIAESGILIQESIGDEETRIIYLICSTGEEIKDFSEDFFSREKARLNQLLDASGLKDETARQLLLASDAFLSEKDSTGGKTLLAGYPFFGDWGRDTMISFRGCVLAAGRTREAKEIMKTFLQYEKNGLVPNLFPDRNQEPVYNSVDAPLLLINGIYLYYEKTQDIAFVREAWPVMNRIISAYRLGTSYGIHMDEDGLIMAGTGKYQLTWMDVCVNGFLPTPRHGKPVEINAYWYNALKIMEFLSREIKELLTFRVEELSELVKKSFIEKFWIEDKGYLRDLVSGTAEDEQIRCNQIWAISQPFSMLDRKKSGMVLACVKKHLYTPVGLRTLSPQDKDFHPFYGGTVWERDNAYHQGTVWPFPLGAYYLAYLKVNEETPEAAEAVREALAPICAALREGCIGQLPEIYDGLYPGESRGCFAQAWSVGEILSVYSKIEEIINES